MTDWTDFNGSFRSVAKPDDKGMLLVDEYILLPAPNRYRKLVKKRVVDNDGVEHVFLAPNPACPNLMAALDDAFDNDVAIAMQIKEFDLPNPIGLQFDLFDTYIAWEVRA